MSPKLSAIIRPLFDRRRFLAGAGAIALGGCDRITNDEYVQRAFDIAEQASYRSQRLLQGRESLAPEYPESDITKVFKPNGSTSPSDAAYKRHVKEKFAKWHLQIDGLVENPRGLTLAELRGLPPRTQITRHDCVEGWSCIGKWTGTPLSVVLEIVKPKAEAKFVVFHCADTDQDVSGASDDAEDSDEQTKDSGKGKQSSESGQGKKGGKSLSPADGYYESVDLADALHAQTILAYEMNGNTLPVEHGAPLRVRLERQLGYKMAKYVMRIELVDSIARFGRGKGGYWEDRGYDWYAGI